MMSGVFFFFLYLKSAYFLVEMLDLAFHYNVFVAKQNILDGKIPHKEPFNSVCHITIRRICLLFSPISDWPLASLSLSNIRARLSHEWMHKYVFTF